MSAEIAEDRPRLAALIFEVTARCDHDCLYCYNVWKNHGCSPPGELDTAGVERILDRVFAQCRPTNVTLSGGEPLLRADLPRIAASIRRRGADVNVITNGSLIDARLARDLVHAGVSLLEVALLAADRTIHDRLTRAASFDAVVDGLADLAHAGVPFVTAIVLTRQNAAALEQTLALSLALGAEGAMINRFNPGGTGARHVETLMPDPAQLAEALAVADRFAEAYDFPISTPIPVPPCVLDTTPFRHLTFPACAAGTAEAYFTVGPSGHLRPCNHSPTVLGHVLDEPLSALIAPVRLQPFLGPVPQTCQECAALARCRTSCRAAAEACCGSTAHLDPFAARFGHPPSVLATDGSTRAPFTDRRT